MANSLERVVGCCYRQDVGLGRNQDEPIRDDEREVNCLKARASPFFRVVSPGFIGSRMGEVIVISAPCSLAGST